MPDDPNDDDEKLWALARKGDEGARNALFAALRGVLLRFFANKVGVAYARLGDCTIERLSEVFDDLDRAVPIRVHALRIAVDVARRFRASTEQVTYGEGICELLLGTEPGSGDTLESRAIEALRALPLDQQIVFELYFCEGLGHDEIAQVLEVPVQTVRARLARGRRVLAERMSDTASASR